MWPVPWHNQLVVFREQEYREPCALCDELSTDSCVRCSRALCAQHGVGGNRRCEACEAAFERLCIAELGDEPVAKNANLPLAFFFVGQAALFAILLVILLAFTPGSVAVIASLIACAVVMLLLGPKGLSRVADSELHATWVRDRRRLRSQFLAERPALPAARNRELLPAGEVED